jgi:hypothetical protein
MFDISLDLIQPVYSSKMLGKQVMRILCVVLAKNVDKQVIVFGKSLKLLYIKPAWSCPFRSASIFYDQAHFTAAIGNEKFYVGAQRAQKRDDVNMMNMKRVRAC